MPCVHVVTRQVGVRALRLGLSRYLAEVEQGAEVLVTDRGRPVARLLPVQGSSEERLASLVATGEAEAASVAKDEWLPEPVPLPEGITVSDLAADQRR
jgi:prevent-host-death family protein